MNDAAVALAYKHCERITRIAGTQFLLRDPPPARPHKRSAMCALVRHGTPHRRRRRRTSSRRRTEAAARPGRLTRPRSGARHRSRCSPEASAEGAGGRRPARRPGADGAGRHRPPVPAARRRLRGTGRGVRMGHRRPPVRELRRARRVLPAGRRHHRPFVPGHLREQRPGRRRTAGRCPRGRAAAHQHPARLDRGP